MAFLSTENRTCTQDTDRTRIQDVFDQRSVIDYFISSDKRIVNNVKVIPGVSLDADHRMIVAKVKVRNFRKQHLYKSKIIKTKSLNEQEKRTEYKRRINEKLNG